MARLAPAGATAVFLVVGLVSLFDAGEAVRVTRWLKPRRQRELLVQRMMRGTQWGADQPSHRHREGPQGEVGDGDEIDSFGEDGDEEPPPIVPQHMSKDQKYQSIGSYRSAKPAVQRNFVNQCAMQWQTVPLKMHRTARCSRELWVDFNRTDAIRHCTEDWHCWGLEWRDRGVEAPMSNELGAFRGCGGELEENRTNEWIVIEKPLSCQEESEKCAGCDMIIDLRCLHAGAWRHAYYHRIVDCLVPMYGLIQKAREEPGRTCAISYFHGSLFGEGIDLSIFDATLWRTANLKHIDEDARCVDNLRYYAALPEKVHGVPWRAYHLNDTKLIADVGVDLGMNVAALRKDVKNYLEGVGAPTTPQGKPYIVFIRRVGTRELVRDAEEYLRQKVAGMGYIMRTYYGNESIEETFRMWALAGAVVGYHGAGFANAMFVLQPTCVSELSTFLDVEGIKPWRTNNYLSEMNPLLKWRTFNLPLGQQLEINEVDKSEIVNVSSAQADKLVKDLPFVHVTTAQMDEIARHLMSCLS